MVDFKKAIFGSSTTQDPVNPNTAPQTTNNSNTIPRTSETGTLDSNIGNDAVTGQHHHHSTNDPSYTHGNTGIAGASTYGTSGNVASTSTNAGPHDSNLANKVDPRVDSDRDGSRVVGNTTNTTNTTSAGYGTGNTSSTIGPHDSNLANKADPRVDSDGSGSRFTEHTTSTGTQGVGNTTGTGYGVGNASSTTAGPHTSNLANRADPRVDSDRDGSRLVGNTTGAGSYGVGNTSSTTAGPHTSNLANRADPRVDSDLDGSRTATGTTHGAGGAAVGGQGLHTATNESRLATEGYNTSTTGTGYSSSTNAGPHDSNLANKVDPRVDSDRDGSRVAGTTGTAAYGASNTGSQIPGATHSTSTNAGPHDSNLANKVDPRVDSDRDGSRVAGTTGTAGTAAYGSTTTGNQFPGASHSTSTNAGPHNSNLANKADPRVDSDRDGSRLAGTAGAGAYGSSNTGSQLPGATYSTSTNAGPHDSNLANKADPRVDSDRDGSRIAGTAGTASTVGTAGTAGTAAYGASNTGNQLPGATHSTSTTAGPHDSSLANKADPRVDSDLSRTTGHSSTNPALTGATHSTSTTAGPHDSSLANKADPRVDSDLSRTTGHTSTNSALTGATGTTTGTEFRGNQTSNVDNTTSRTGAISGRQGIDGPGETPSRGLHPIGDNHGPMTGSHSHRGSGQFHATQDTYDTLHRRDHADGADYTRPSEGRTEGTHLSTHSENPKLDGKGTPGAMPEMIKQGLEELYESKR